MSRRRLKLLGCASSHASRAALLLVAVSACGSPATPSGDAGAGRAGDAPAEGADDAPPFSLGLAPPNVDCRRYARLQACVLHVAARGAAGADGLTWQTPLDDVQDALDRATCGCAVWIETGTYLPTRSLDAAGASPDPRNRSFVLWPGVHVLGGFQRQDDPGQRLAGQGETTLSGDLGAAGVRDDNAYHVVVGADRAELDGLAIRDGEANGFELGQGVGAGVLAFSANMTLRNVTLSDNDADSGAGIFGDERSSPHLVGCTLARNTANDGGGLVVLGATAVVESSVFEDNVGVFSGPAITTFAKAVTVTDSRFLRNRGDSGGAVTVSDGQATFERAWFEGNQAGSFGGAILVRFGATAHLASSVLVANASVGFGGAIAVWTASAEVEGVTLVDNAAGFGGAFLVKDGSRLRVADTVVWRSIDDLGNAFDLDGAPSALDVTTSDLAPEVVAAASFDLDPRLANVPVATRFAVQAGDTDRLPIAGASNVFTSGDRVELGDDGVERRVTSVQGDDVSFAPPLAAPAPRFLRIDLWAPDAPSLALDLTPLPGSPLVDGASAQAPKKDVFGHARVRAPDLGAVEAP